MKKICLLIKRLYFFIFKKIRMPYISSESRIYHIKEINDLDYIKLEGYKVWGVKSISPFLDMSPRIYDFIVYEGCLYMIFDINKYKKKGSVKFNGVVSCLGSLEEVSFVYPILNNLRVY